MAMIKYLQLKNLKEKINRAVKFIKMKQSKKPEGQFIIATNFFPLLSHEPIK